MFSITGLLAALAVGTAQAPAADQCPSVELRAEARLARTADVTGASASFADGAWGLGLEFGKDAGSRLRSYTASHVGQRMTLALNGQPARTMKILDPLETDRIWISPMDETEAKALADRFTACAAAARRSP